MRNLQAPELRIQAFERQDRAFPWKSVPHQKIVIIDGLLAFKASTNLTTNGLRQAGKGRDLLEVVSNIEDVADLNNCYFSPVWAGLSDEGAIFEMDPLPPDLR